jgi:hypothetical protein
MVGVFYLTIYLLNMGIRLIITEEEKTYIRQSYGLVSEGLDKEKTTILRNNFLGKTINLYNDRDQQDLYTMSRIDGIEFRDPELNSGRVVLDLYGSKYEIGCLANPDRLESALHYIPSSTGISQVRYNKQFTDKLLSISNGWCKKPNADFAKTNTIPSTTA